MAIHKFEVTVTQVVLVELDDAKLNQEFNKAFSGVFFHVDSLEDHAKHLAQMEARGLIGFDHFVEGYGDLRKLNCRVGVCSQEEEVGEVAHA